MDGDGDEGQDHTGTAVAASSDTMRHVHWRRTVVVVAVATFFIVPFLSRVPQTGGLSVVTTNGQTSVTGGTTPMLIGMSILVWLLYWIVLDGDEPFLAKKPAGVIRRFMAAFVDLFLAIFGLSGLSGIFPVLVEWRITGEFAWQIERDYARSSDSILLWSGLPLIFAGLVLYFAYPMTRGRTTIGEYLWGYRVLREGKPEHLPWKRALARSLADFGALSSWPVTLLMKRRPGQIWTDTAFGTKAVVVTNYEGPDSPTAGQ